MPPQAMATNSLMIERQRQALKIHHREIQGKEHDAKDDQPTEEW
jgi:hypothetical protein